MGYELVQRGHRLDDRIRNFLRRVVGHVSEVWQEPDRGIWEVRGAKRHYPYSKLMAWVALDRAVLLSEHDEWPGNVEHWRNRAEKTRERIIEEGFDRKLGAFTTAFGSGEPDAALMRIPLLEFLPADDERVQGTIDAIMENLMSGCFMHRYRFDDGLPGEEGAFGLCTFWLVDALALSGRLDEARGILTDMLDHASDLGLYSEMFDPESGAFLGNFPQAFTHIGLINSALYLSWAEGRVPDEYAPIGTKQRLAGDDTNPEQ